MYESDDVDDYSNLPLEGLGKAAPLVPDPRSQRMHELLQQASPKALALGKGKSVLQRHQEGQSPRAIAEVTQLTTGEVRSLTETYDDALPAERSSMQGMVLSKNSVFDLYARLQEHADEINASMKFLDDPEIRVQYIAERLKLFKLVNEVMKDVTFKKQEEDRRRRREQLIIDHLKALDPVLASQLFKALEEDRKREQAVSGG